MRDDFRFFRTSLLVFWIRFCRTVRKTTKNKETNTQKELMFSILENLSAL